MSADVIDSAICRHFGMHITGCCDCRRERTYLVTVTVEVTGYDADGAREQVEDAIKPHFAQPIVVDQIEEMER